jgi:TRAP-type C4-dicarboxylate transport system substrate-binding protein
MALTLCLAPSAHAKKIKIATIAPKGSVFYTVLKDLGDEWKTLSKGQIKLKIYPGGVAGGDREVMRKIKLGTLHGGLITATGLSVLDKSVNALQIPLAYRDYGEADYVRTQMHPGLAAIYAEKGFEILGWAEAGWIRFIGKTPIRVPADRAGHKFFVIAGDPEQAAVWKAAGFMVVPLPTAEISTGLQTGLITAMPTTAQAALLLQWYKHAPHMMARAWAPLMGAFVVDKRVWDRVEPSLRADLAAAARRATDRLLQESRRAEVASVEAMKKRGLVVHPVTQVHLEAWRALVQSAHDAIRGPYAPAAKYDEAMGHLDAYRKAKGE